MKKLSAVLFVVLLALQGKAQDDLFGTTKKEPKKGMIIAFAAGFDLPAADMARRFGSDWRIGPSLLYKTKSNWLIGAKADFILGGKIKEPGFLANMSDNQNSYLTFNGLRADIGTYERGYMLGIQAGKIFATNASHPDNGWTTLTSAGFIQHKILIETSKSGFLPQLEGDYRKGYDRLTNGWFLEQFLGYTFFSRNGLINFYIGADVVAGFTAGRRDYWLDVQQPGDGSRFDMLYGLRGAWFIPVFKRKSEEFFFE